MRNLVAVFASGVSLCACGNSGSSADARPPADARADAPVADAIPGPDAANALVPDVLPDPLPTGSPDLTVVTFNAGILGTVKGAAERRPRQIAALKALDADVICIQESYHRRSSQPYNDPLTYAGLLEDTYPYAFWTWTGTSSGRSGLLIVSKHPLYRGREIRYVEGNDSSTVDRMAIAATAVDTNEAWYAHIICTHLHAGLATADVTIKSAEAAELLTWTTTQGYDAGPSFMLGDFNTGPGTPPDDCECEEDSCLPACSPVDMVTYNLMIDAGWNDPFDTADSPFWTSERAQYLELEVIPGLYPNEPSQRIDHCFHKGISPSTFQAGIPALNEPQDITVGADTIHYLSDHFAVSCTFAP